MVAITDRQKARLLDLTRNALELSLDGNRNIDEVCDILQVVKDRPNFAELLLAKKAGQEIVPPLPMLSLPTEHIVVCNRDKFSAAPNLEVEAHRDCGTMQLESRDGKLLVNGRGVIRHLSPSQKDGKTIRGFELREELKNEPTLCTCVLAYLYEHQELIPESWKSGPTFFWATILRGDDRLSVACLYRINRFHRRCSWLGIGFDSDAPVALLASN